MKTLDREYTDIRLKRREALGVVVERQFMAGALRSLPKAAKAYGKAAASIAAVAGATLLLSATPMWAQADSEQLTSLPPAGATPSDVTLHYDIMVGGLHATSLQFSLSLDESDGEEEAYFGQFKAQAEGMLSWIVDFQMTSEINGTLTEDGFRPEHYESLSTWRDNERRVAIDFDANGIPQAEVVPQPDRAPVPYEYRDGTLDPLSSILTLIYGAAAGGCDDQVEAYDGRRVYRISINGGEQVVLPESSINIYEGDAITCDVSVDRVLEVWRGETTPGRPKKRYLQDIKAYFAPIVEGFPSLPVRLEAMSAYGGARAHLVKIERN